MENGKIKVCNKPFYKQESLDQQVQSSEICITPYHITPINISSCTRFSFSSNILNLRVLLPRAGRGGPGAAHLYVPCRTCPRGQGTRTLLLRTHRTSTGQRPVSERGRRDASRCPVGALCLNNRFLLERKRIFLLGRSGGKKIAAFFLLPGTCHPFLASSQKRRASRAKLGPVPSPGCGTNTRTAAPGSKVGSDGAKGECCQPPDRSPPYLPTPALCYY